MNKPTRAKGAKGNMKEGKENHFHVPSFIPYLQERLVLRHVIHKAPFPTLPL